LGYGATEPEEKEGAIFYQPDFWRLTDSRN